LLAIRDNAEHKSSIEEPRIAPIDLLLFILSVRGGRSIKRRVEIASRISNIGGPAIAAPLRNH